MTTEAILALLEGVRKGSAGWSAKCPSHDDRAASLSVSSSRDGNTLLKCHAGCTCADICASLDIPISALFECRPTMKTSKPHVVATYRYCDERGGLLYQKRRYEPKSFAFFSPEGKAGINGVRRVPYRLDQLLAAPPDEPVLVVEGEKDVDTLVKLGFVATTNDGGAGKWPGEFGKLLAKRYVVVIPDNDKLGREHAAKVCESAKPHAAAIKLLELPGLPEKGDASDWIAAGGTREELVKLVEAAPIWTQGAPSLPLLELVSPFSITAEAPRYLIGGLVARDKRIVIGGEPKAGKSLVALLMAICLATGRRFLDKWPVNERGRTLILSTEGGAPFACTRLQQLAWGLGLDADETRAVEESIRVVKGGRVNLCDAGSVALLRRTVESWRPDLVILDPFADLTSGPENDKESMAPACQAISDQLEAMPGHAVIVVHHVSKGGGDRSLGYALRGSSYLAGWYDSILSIRKGEEGQPRRIDGEHRFAVEPTPVGFRILGGVGAGPDLPSLRLDSCDPPEKAKRGRPRKVDLFLDAVARVVKDFPGCTKAHAVAKVLEATKDATSSTVKRAIKELLEAQVLREEHGRLYLVTE